MIGKVLVAKCLTQAQCLLCDKEEDMEKEKSFRQLKWRLSFISLKKHQLSRVRVSIACVLMVIVLVAAVLHFGHIELRG